MDVYQLVTGTEGISHVVLLRPPIVLLFFLIHGIVTAKLYRYKITTFHFVPVLLGFTATLSVCHATYESSCRKHRLFKAIHSIVR